MVKANSHLTPKWSASVNISLARPPHCLNTLPTLWPPAVVEICQSNYTHLSYQTVTTNTIQTLYSNFPFCAGRFVHDESIYRHRQNEILTVALKRRKKRVRSHSQVVFMYSYYEHSNAYFFGIIMPIYFEQDMTIIVHTPCRAVMSVVDWRCLCKQADGLWHSAGCNVPIRVNFFGERFWPVGHTDLVFLCAIRVH